MTHSYYDKIIIGAGLFGLYAAQIAAEKGEKVCVLEYETEPFTRATYANQARVHLGYHYPRSYATAKKSAGYFDRFSTMYTPCIHSDFQKIYATSKQFSWTNADQFSHFCNAVNIPCRPLAVSEFFNGNMCDGTFETKEYTYDAQILKDLLLNTIKDLPQLTIRYAARIRAIKKETENYTVHLESGASFSAPFLLNATYASINQMIQHLGETPFQIKYELCEIILVKPNAALATKGITVMDGPFFSIMPFGKTGYHSLTSVTFTPHKTSYETLPTFSCQQESQGHCSPLQLGNCNTCPSKPQTAWPYMRSLAKKYLTSDYDFTYEASLFAIKPILMASEIDDSRPTVVKVFSENPTFVSVLSGKINAVYDLEEVLSAYEK